MPNNSDKSDLIQRESSCTAKNEPQIEIIFKKSKREVIFFQLNLVIIYKVWSLKSSKVTAISE